jgi:hypothetical protein
LSEKIHKFIEIKGEKSPFINFIKDNSKYYKKMYFWCDNIELKYIQEVRMVDEIINGYSYNMLTVTLYKTKSFQFTFDSEFNIKSTQLKKYLKVESDIIPIFEKALIKDRFHGY